MDDERSHIENLINAHRNRLQKLEIQAAQYGIDARPVVLIEIDDIRREIQRLEQELLNLDRQEGPALNQSKSELDKMVESVKVQLGNVLYQIERYQNSSIKVLNTNTQEYVTALPILRQVNSEKALGINLFWPNGREKNTRTLGREVMRALVDQN